MSSRSQTQRLEEMFDSFFRLLHPAPRVPAPRLGKLLVLGRNHLHTPHYLAITSRGIIPHITHDVMRERMSIGAVYLALEDFIEKAPGEVPPVYKMPATAHESALRKFTCLPEDILLVMGPRRAPPVPCATSNMENSISIQTSVGVCQLEADYYTEASERLRPDFVVGLADLVVGRKPGVKRREKMVDRTHAYTRDATQRLYGSGREPESRLGTLYVAPVLPLEDTQQILYLASLGDELKEHVSGLALYESASLAIIPESLGHLPRLTFGEPKSPQDVLRDVSLGADLVTIPFVGAATDGGIALDFTFPPPVIAESDERKALGIDMWSSAYAADLSPLVLECQCYTCTKHHRAYIRHLLSAKEMLAWALLQIHNYHIIELFFAAIRDSIENGTFEIGVQMFEQTYQSVLPQQTGQGPRLRGYHFRASGPGERKRNPSAYGQLDNTIEKFAGAQSAAVTPDADADELQVRGFVEKETEADSLNKQVFEDK